MKPVRLVPFLIGTAFLAGCGPAAVQQPPAGFYVSSSSAQWASESDYASAAPASSAAALSSEASSAPSSAMSPVALSSASGGLTPSRTVVTVFQEWATAKGDPVVSGLYRTNPYVTEAFRGALASAGTMEPVFCRTRKPPAFAVTSMQTTGEMSAVAVREDYPEGALALRASLKKEGGIWKIDAVDCPAPSSASASSVR
jgi:hypothetical protein